MNTNHNMLAQLLTVTRWMFVLLILASAVASPAKASNNQDELRKTLAKLSECITSGSTVVTRIRTGSLEFWQDYLVEFARYKDTEETTLSALQQVREDISARNLYMLRRQLAEIQIQLRALTLWVHLGATEQPGKAIKQYELQAIDQSAQDFSTQVFLYDLEVSNLLVDSQK